MATGNLHNYGGPDEATEMIIATAYDSLFYDIGFDCDPASLGKGYPSQWTIAQSELNIATDCLLEVMQEIKNDGETKFSVITDHSHRGGQDHFDIVLCWAGLDANG